MSQETGNTRAKPRGLRELTLLMCALNLTVFLWADGSTLGSRGADIALYASIGAISFLVLWFFWRGRNWARILVLITSVLGVLGLLTLLEETLLQRVVTMIDAVLSVFLLYWLNTRPVKEYFKPVQAVALQDPGLSVPPIPEP